MGYSEKRGSGAGTYYRGRYKVGPGKYGTVSDSTGATIKFAKAREAKQAADREEAKLAEARRPWVDRRTIPTLGQFVQTWWPTVQDDLAESTLDGYRDVIEVHLLPTFGAVSMADIDRAAVEEWKRSKREGGYAANSITTYGNVLHLLFADAIAQGVPLPENPCARRRGRGRRSGRTGRSDHRAEEKVSTTPLGLLLIAERAALLTGRDDEFVQVVGKGYTGMRTGETVGLSRPYIRPGRIRVEWQLYQQRGSTSWLWCPPKDDSRRWVDTPPWLDGLYADQLARVHPQPCPCHGQRTIFRGLAQQASRVTLADIADAVGVSQTTVSRVRRLGTGRPEVVAQVQKAAARLERERPTSYHPHVTRAVWRAAAITPAASGFYPRLSAERDAYPVGVDGAAPWPGAVLHGRAYPQATACWVAIAPGLTDHGLRHTHSVMLDLLGTPKVLQDERLGHLDGSVQARYKHVTQSMRDELLEGLTRLWEESLTARLQLSPTSPVSILDRLLQEHAAKFSQNSPQAVMRRAVLRASTVPEQGLWKSGATIKA